MAYQYADTASQELLRMVPPDGQVVGSIGCGWGTTEAVLVAQGRTVHGVDVSPESIEVAKARLTTARVIDPGDRKPFEPNSLDGLILGDVIEHLPAAWDALRQYAEAVKPGGWVVISVPNMRNLVVARTFILKGEWPEDAVGLFDATHLQVMTRRRLLRWCRAAGLRLDQWYDRHICFSGWKSVAVRSFDKLTFRLFHEWLTLQHQGRFRKV